MSFMEESRDQAVDITTELPDESPYSKVSKIRKAKLLIFCQTGVTANVRVLSKDLIKLLPHSRAEIKYAKGNLSNISEVLELRNSNRCLFFQVKKKRDVYMWLSALPDGPTIKFMVENIHTVDSLNFTGNCVLNARALLTFSPEFEEPHLKVIKNALLETFSTPPRCKGALRHVDHVMTFYYFDKRVWFRNYQICPDSDAVKEIGPRFTLNPICIMNGVFRGEILYKNPDYTSPSQHLKKVAIEASLKFKKRVKKRIFHKNEVATRLHPIDEIDSVFSCAK